MSIRRRARVSSDATVIGTGDETPACMGTENPGARLLSGARGALALSAADAALLPGSAPGGLVLEPAPRNDLRDHPAAEAV
jgi:hypothetical protein